MFCVACLIALLLNVLPPAHPHTHITTQGLAKRHIGSTNMNHESSRSHLIISCLIEGVNLQSQAVTRGKISFVDLAGSERCVLVFFWDEEEGGMMGRGLVGWLVWQAREVLSGRNGFTAI